MKWCFVWTRPQAPSPYSLPKRHNAIRATAIKFSSTIIVIVSSFLAPNSDHSEMSISNTKYLLNNYLGLWLIWMNVVMILFCLNNIEIDCAYLWTLEFIVCLIFCHNVFYGQMCIANVFIMFSNILVFMHLGRFLQSLHISHV